MNRATNGSLNDAIEVSMRGSMQRGPRRGAALLARAAVIAVPAALLACAAGVAAAGNPPAKPAGPAPAAGASAAKPGAPAAKPGASAAKPAAGASAAKPAAMPVAAPDPPLVLDLAMLASSSRTAEPAQDQLRAALVKGKPEGVTFSAVLDLGGGAVAVAWSECSKAACRGSVATLSGTPLKLVKKAALVAPSKVHFLDGFAFAPPAFADLDGDGAAEIVLHYHVAEPPRPALGSLTREYIAVYDPRTLAIVFSHELRRAGADSEEACHWTLEQGGDRLIATGHCNKRACAEVNSLPALCKPTKKLVETWRKAPGQKRYSKVPR